MPWGGGGGGDEKVFDCGQGSLVSLILGNQFGVQAVEPCDQFLLFGAFNEVGLFQPFFIDGGGSRKRLDAISLGVRRLGLGPGLCVPQARARPPS